MCRQVTQEDQAPVTVRLYVFAAVFSAIACAQEGAGK